MKKSRSAPSSPENMRGMVSGSMTVKVAEASVDMLTPPCSPNSCRAPAMEAAGSSHVRRCDGFLVGKMAVAVLPLSREAIEKDEKMSF